MFFFLDFFLYDSMCAKLETWLFKVQEKYPKSELISSPFVQLWSSRSIVTRVDRKVLKFNAYDEKSSARL